MADKKDSPEFIENMKNMEFIEGSTEELKLFEFFARNGGGNVPAQLCADHCSECPTIEDPAGCWTYIADEGFCPYMYGMKLGDF